jgi:hypothetical protein
VTSLQQVTWDEDSPCWNPEADALERLPVGDVVDADFEEVCTSKEMMSIHTSAKLQGQYDR